MKKKRTKIDIEQKYEKKYVSVHSLIKKVQNMRFIFIKWKFVVKIWEILKMFAA